MFELKDKTALVTGAGRGIGRAFALALAEAGANVIAHYAENQSAAETVRNEIRGMGRQSCVVRADLRSHDCAVTVREGIPDSMKRVDMLILNASVQHRKSWREIDRRDFGEQMDCNLYAGLLLIREFVPDMRRNKWGRIITVGSIHEQKPNPDMLLYAASKAAQTVMAKALAVDLAPDGITVNNLAPGVILTGRNSAALQNETWRNRVTQRIPAGYIGDPGDCAGVLVALCSDAGRYITGQSIHIDGGMSAS